MYGDTSVIRRLAGQMREQAADLRQQADRLVASADAVHWTGRAAEAMRTHMRESAADLRKTADDHDGAAEALMHHAAEVDRLKHLIAAIEHKVHSLIADAKSRLSSLAGKIADGLKHLAPDPVDRVLDSFTPPPPGNKAWLDVDVPGLHL